MKLKSLIILLILLVPFAAAEMTIDNNRLEKRYNLGDDIIVSGSITLTKDDYITLTPMLKCGDRSQSYMQKNFRVLENKQETFYQVLSIPSYFLEDNAKTCNIRLLLERKETGEVIEDKLSNPFEITKELDGNVDIDNKRLQLGEGLNLNGNIFRLNYISVNGLATIYFNNFLIKSNEKVIDGRLSFNFIADSISAGRYNVDVNVKDENGNEKHFGNVTYFEVSDVYLVDVNLNKLIFKPSEEIVLNGEVRDLNNALARNAEVVVEFDGKKYAVSINNGVFSSSFKLIDNVKSGSHDIRVIAKDSYGNYGEKNLDFNVEPIPTKLAYGVNELSFNPGSNVEVVVELYDQAGDLIYDREAKVVIGDVDGKEIFNKEVLTSAKNEFKLDDIAKPGNYKIKVFSYEFSDQGEFKVNIVEDVEITNEEQAIFIKNIGNVPYTKAVEIKFDNKSVVETLNLDVGKTARIDLFKQIENGDYNVEVVSGEKEVDLGKVTIKDERGFFEKALSPITGRAISIEGEAVWSWWYLIIIVGIIVIIILIFWKFGGKKREEMMRERDKKEGANYLERVREEREARRGGKRPLFFAKQIKEEEAKDFRERMLKNIKEDKGSKGSGIFTRKEDEGYRAPGRDWRVNKPLVEKEDNKKNLFRMFD